MQLEICFKLILCMKLFSKDFWARKVLHNIFILDAKILWKILLEKSFWKDYLAN